MSSRIRHESGSHLRKPSHTSLMKKTMDENKINQPNLKPKATLGSGSNTKPNAPNADVKPQTPGLKAKSSRPVLASLTNATPRSKPGLTTHKATKPAVFKTPSAPKTRPPQTPGIKTPLAGPKSTKKTISVYTPARQPPSVENEVEYTHPRPPPLEDGPPSPLREAIEGRWSYTDPEPDHGIDPLNFGLEQPMSPEAISQGLLDSPRRGLTAEFDFDQINDYGF